MAMGMAGLAFGGRAEDGGDVVVALDVGLLGEIEVAAISLAFAGEGRLEIVDRLRCLQRRQGKSSSVVGGQQGQRRARAATDPYMRPRNRPVNSLELI